MTGYVGVQPRLQGAWCRQFCRRFALFRLCLPRLFRFVFLFMFSFARRRQVARCADLLMALALLVLSWFSQEFVMLFGLLPHLLLLLLLFDCGLLI